MSGNAITIPKNQYFKKLNLDQNARMRIYSKICVLWFLVQKIGPHSEWIKNIADLVDSKPDLECLPYTAMGFPDNTGFPREKFQM
jgi:abortive infection bacteriophage resistance protein